MAGPTRHEPEQAPKTTIGLVCADLSFIPLMVAAQQAGAIGVMVAAQQTSATSVMASVWWLVLAYLALELGEMCLSPIGLSAVTQLSVPRVVGLMMGAFWLATAYSEVLAAQFGKIASLEVVEGEAIDMAVAAGKYGALFELMLWFGIGSGVVFLLLTPQARQWMHGVK